MRVLTSAVLRAQGLLDRCTSVDFGAPLHTLVVPGETHFVEEEVLPAMTAWNADCEVVTEMLLDAPPLVATPDSEAEALVARLWTNMPPSVVSFGTDGAFFQKAGLDVVVIGPGGMAQMHQPDEFITEEAMDEGLQFLEQLLDEMSGPAA